ncbi:MAG: hypothetical protein Q9167_004218 [Letrouitia subvulpina]
MKVRTTKLAAHPTEFGNTNGLGGRVLLPRKQLMVGGMAYETPSATTEADVMALKALQEILASVIDFSQATALDASNPHLLDPKNMHPNTMTHIVVRYSALRGNLSVGWTLAKNLEAGRPPSRAKAYVIRLLVVIMEVVAKRRQTSGKLFLSLAANRILKETCQIYINKMMEPGLLLVAWKKM